MYSIDGIDCLQGVSERKRLVRAFTLKMGAAPELLRKTAAFFLR